LIGKPYKGKQMNNKILAMGAILATMIMSGCTQQVASPNPNGVDASGATMVASDTVTLDGDGVSSSNGANSRNGRGANSVYFAYDSNNINQNDKSKIANDAGALKRKSKVKVEGNSDEFGTDEYNYALGLRRAKAVKDSMVVRGVPPKKIVVVSYGESNPVCKDGTKECYQKNRRADYE
jgi:peptidoglycan-associated lipoprotein